MNKLINKIMINKKIAIISVIALIALGGSFYGGMKYGETGKLAPSEFGGTERFLNRENGFQDMQQGGNRENMFNGEVISKDSNSIVVKLLDGSSRIVFFSNNTQVSKTEIGSIDDIEVGLQVVVNGQKNDDGSYIASTIQSSLLIPKINGNSSL